MVKHRQNKVKTLIIIYQGSTADNKLAAKTSPKIYFKFHGKAKEIIAHVVCSEHISTRGDIKSQSKEDIKSQSKEDIKSQLLEEVGIKDLTGNLLSDIVFDFFFLKTTMHGFP